MQKSEKWSKELEQIGNLLRTTPLESSVKWGAEVFTYKGKNVVSYGGFKHHFALWFYNGVFLKDKEKLLTTASEGKTKSLRQWRFSSAEEIDEHKILAYVHEAIEVEKKGLKLQPEQFKPIPLPELFESEFNSHPDVKTAFENLTPGRQKEYILHVTEAKQEATKLKRMEKIKPLILSGKGLHDKYK